MMATCRSSTLRMKWASFTRSVKIAAVPVLHLHDTVRELKAAQPRQRTRAEFNRAAAPVDRHEIARLPWERRAKREARKAKQASASVA